MHVDWDQLPYQWGVDWGIIKTEFHLKKREISWDDTWKLTNFHKFHFKCPPRATRLRSSLRENLCGCNRWHFHLLSSGIGESQEYDPLWCTVGPWNPSYHPWVQWSVFPTLGLLFVANPAAAASHREEETRVSRLISDGKEWEAWKGAAPSLVHTGDLPSSSLKENTKTPIKLLPVCMIWHIECKTRPQVKLTSDSGAKREQFYLQWLPPEEHIHTEY